MSLLLDRVITFSASLRLAIGVIVLLAGYLAVGTLYESRYGTRAAAVMVYQSPVFAGILGLLAINVLMAAVVRFPWKRHQSGFVITHIGIEVLLLGCLIGATGGVDGRMFLRVGDEIDAVELTEERLAVLGVGGTVSAPLNLWGVAGYPPVWRFCLVDVWQSAAPKWNNGAQISIDLGKNPEGAQVRVIEWQRAVRIDRAYVASDTGEAAARVRVLGTTPDGATIDQTTWASASSPAELFGGMIRIEIQDPQTPRAASAPPSRGRLILRRDGEHWRGVLIGATAVMRSFDVQVGATEPAWMSLKLCVTELLDCAVPRENVIPIRVAASQVDSAVAAVRVVVARHDQDQEVWLVRGEPAKDLGVPVAYAFAAAELPFVVKLTEASPGQARVEVRSRAGITTGHTITPNHPAVVSGRSIYLSSVETVGGQPVALMSVRHDPGWPLKYSGSGLIVLGTVMMFLIRKPVPAERLSPAQPTDAVPSSRPKDSTIPRRATMSALLLVLLLAPLARGAVDLAPARTIPIEHGDRVKPLDTVARETVRFLRGRETGDSLQTLLQWTADPAAAEGEAILLVQNLELRARLNMPADAKRVAPADLRANQAFLDWSGALLERKRVADAHGELATLDKQESAAIDLRRRMDVFDSVTNRAIYRAVVVENAALRSRAIERWLGAFSRDDSAAFRGESMMMRSLSAPNARAMSREVAYNRVHPFRWVMGLYASAVFVMTASRFFSRGDSDTRLWKSFAVLGVLAHAGAFAWRCSISGWAPVTNMYETVVWVGGVAAAMGLLLSARSRTVLPAAGGTVVALLACIVGDVMPPELGSSVLTLAPVLRSNLWLTIHVLTVVSSYAAFALAMVMGNALVWRLGSPRANPNDETRNPNQIRNQNDEVDPSSFGLRHSDLIRVSGFDIRVSRNVVLLYRTLQLGVILIAAGTLLGAMWADVSWGRFWGWDPKEVWALVVLLSYLALLHGKSAGWVKEFGLAAGAVLCFVTVLMSWYGVNFVLGAGLHSYGFGSGGIGYVLSYVVAQVGFVIWVTWRYRRVIRAAGESEEQPWQKQPKLKESTTST